uniref:Bicarbonate transporter-like transmembrane domain-containing protein n=1 Tax=Panagrolaimus superbus TaxID=310955 RepID=A0A914YF95_9BILA
MSDTSSIISSTEGSIHFDIEEPTLSAANNEQVFLLNSVQQAIPPKDFFVEIRGILDVEHLLDNAIVILDASETQIDTIIQRVVDEINPTRDVILYRDVESKIFSYSDFSDLRVPSIRHKLQGVFVKTNDVIVDQSWLTIYCSIDGLFHRHIGFVRMNLPTNFGPGLGDVQFILLVIAPMVEKGTKTAFETSRTFSTLLCDPALRQRLLDVHDKANFIQEINITVDRMAFQLPTQLERKIEKVVHKKERWWPCKGIINDFKRRKQCYISDYTDGFCDARAIQKTISSAVFLYFAILPTAIALGMLNDSNTHGLITVKKEILAQWIGGLIFGVFGGQLFLIMLSTAPISIYIEVIHQISETGGYDFFKMFTTTGIWCSAFLILFAIFQFSALMKYAKRSLEELFGLFIAIALIYKAMQAIITTFQRYDPSCSTYDPLSCDRSVGLLFVLLLCGTLWISLTLYNFRTTPFLTKTKRELLSDYALPIGVIIMSFIGSFCFKDVPSKFIFNVSKIFVP